MFSLVTLLVAQSLSTPQADVYNLPALFAATCLDGQAKLSANEVTKIGFEDLPSELKSRLGRPRSADVWRLNGSGRAYLYILNYPDLPGISPKICGVASDEMDLRLGAKMLDLRLAGDVLANESRDMQWLRPQDGYVATATTAAEFKVLQINWLSQADRKRTMKDLGSLPK